MVAAEGHVDGSWCWQRLILKPDFCSEWLRLIISLTVYVQWGWVRAAPITAQGGAAPPRTRIRDTQLQGVELGQRMRATDPLGPSKPLLAIYVRLFLEEGAAVPMASSAAQTMPAKVGMGFP